MEQVKVCFCFSLRQHYLHQVRGYHLSLTGTPKVFDNTKLFFLIDIITMLIFCEQIVFNVMLLELFFDL